MPSMSDFEIRIASSRQEIESAQRLRFEVFNLEMKKGLEASYATGLDRDEFDDLCDHILILDKTEKTVIGTYRLLLGRRLGAAGKFYAENEFDLSNLGG
ncbi:MAG: GNAT family N-acetyltransferase, partial [Candidatus Omnitrophica bacterium]|nr:GNAT family N-acetyltransferase [Candidatus Omnitrophota bacterium]